MPPENSAIRCPPVVATMPEVKVPVRRSGGSVGSAGSGRSSFRIFMVVSSLWITSPWAAWPMSSA